MPSLQGKPLQHPYPGLLLLDGKLEPALAAGAWLAGQAGNLELALGRACCAHPDSGGAGPEAVPQLPPLSNLLTAPPRIARCQQGKRWPAHLSQGDSGWKSLQGGALRILQEAGG